MTNTKGPRRGEAGRLGVDVRSDLHVVFETREAGGIELQVQSKVETFYGEAIRSQARQILGALGVEHGFLAVTDYGALPFVIAARIEAAVRRAGLAADSRFLMPPVPRPAPSMRDRLRRSRLYLPGQEPKFMVNAGLHLPDGIILDLEDSVHPLEKDAARLLVRNALRVIDFGAAERMVRINQLPLGLADIEEVVRERPDLILIPKVETADQVIEVDRKIRQVSAQADFDSPIWLMPILESALGIENAFEIARASDRVVALTIGLEDYTADLGVVKTKEGAETLFARQRLVNAAKAAGVQAIDSVYGDVSDLEGLFAWGERARNMGYEGMGCIHPRQIEVIHRAFAPSEVEINKALRIVGAFEEAKAKGLGVISLGSKMIDPPVVNRALKLVAQARNMGLLPAAEGGQ